MLPQWVKANKEAISTGFVTADQVIFVLLGTSMFVAGFLGFVLDNTIPGTNKERGVDKWRAQNDLETEGKPNACYDFPVGMSLIRRYGNVQPKVKKFFIQSCTCAPQYIQVF